MRFALLIVLFAVTSLTAQNQARFGASIPLDTSLLGNAVQMTTDGASRKAHWSVDGKKLMIISSETGKCPQAYWMDPMTKERKLASSGKGSVRSAVPLVKSKSWVYDSTQDAGDACAPTMLGSVPAAFNIFLMNEKGKVQRLASASGYDADVDVSTSEKLIVRSEEHS